MAQFTDFTKNKVGPTRRTIVFWRYKFQNIIFKRKNIGIPLSVHYILLIWQFLFISTLFFLVSFVRLRCACFHYSSFAFFCSENPFCYSYRWFFYCFAIFYSDFVQQWIFLRNIKLNGWKISRRSSGLIEKFNLTQSGVFFPRFKQSISLENDLVLQSTEFWIRYFRCTVYNKYFFLTANRTDEPFVWYSCVCARVYFWYNFSIHLDRFRKNFHNSMVIYTFDYSKKIWNDGKQISIKQTQQAINSVLKKKRETQTYFDALIFGFHSHKSTLCALWHFAYLSVFIICSSSCEFGAWFGGFYQYNFVMCSHSNHE